jgi:SAM-dependent methyltransferase
VRRRRAISPDYTPISSIYSLDDYEAAVTQEDPHYVTGQAALLRAAAEMLSRRDNRILEIGAGSGILTEKLASTFPHMSITVVEPDDEWFAKLVRRTRSFPNVRLVRGLFEDYHNGRYDLCCASFALHHIPYSRKRRVLVRVSELLRDEAGLLVVDKFISHFRNEHERRAALKTYHGYFLAWKALHQLPRGVTFEVTSLRSNLEMRGDYKTSLAQFISDCGVTFSLNAVTKIAPLANEPVALPQVYEALRLAGAPPSALEHRAIETQLINDDWGMYVLELRNHMRL